MTKPEIKFAEILTTIGFEVKFFNDLSYNDPVNTSYMQHRWDRFLFDFTIPALKIAIEIDGEHWHGKKFRITAIMAKKIITDNEKREFIRQNGWVLIRLNSNDVSARGINRRIKSAIFECVETNGI